MDPLSDNQLFPIVMSVGDGLKDNNSAIDTQSVVCSEKSKAKEEVNISKDVASMKKCGKVAQEPDLSCIQITHFEKDVGIEDAMCSDLQCKDSKMA